MAQEYLFIAILCFKMSRVNKALSTVATRVFRVRLLHAVAFSKKLCWLAQTKEITYFY